MIIESNAWNPQGRTPGTGVRGQQAETCVLGALAAGHPARSGRSEARATPPRSSEAAQILAAAAHVSRETFWWNPCERRVAPLIGQAPPPVSSSLLNAMFHVKQLREDPVSRDVVMRDTSLPPLAFDTVIPSTFHVKHRPSSAATPR